MIYMLWFRVFKDAAGLIDKARWLRLRKKKLKERGRRDFAPRLTK